MINPIETRYAGCRFRSRLEARYAVLFDSLGVRWEYEPQGFHVGPQRRSYLPDFYLTDLGCWVEVKGDPQRLDVSLLVDAVHPTLGIGRRDAWYRTNILILGPIPEVRDAFPLHYAISQATFGHIVKGCQGACYFTGPLFSLAQFLPAEYVISCKSVKDDMQSRDVKKLRQMGALLLPFGRPTPKRPRWDLTRTLLAPVVRPSSELEAAYLAGRTARFEWGEAA